MTLPLPREINDRILNEGCEKYPARYGDNDDGTTTSKRIGYQAGATEWAGKAQPIIDALQYLYDGYGEDWPADVKSIVLTALAKYKEVSNEGN